MCWRLKEACSFERRQRKKSYLLDLFTISIHTLAKVGDTAHAEVNVNHLLIQNVFQMSFFGRGGSSSSGAPSSSSPGSSPLSGSQDAKKMEVMNQVRQELASAHLQELVNVRSHVRLLVA